MNDNFENQKIVSFSQKLRSRMLKLKYGKRLKMDGPVKIKGKQPVFKIPGNGVIILGNNVVLNSDAFNSNTALTFSCTLVCGLNGVIQIGDNTMLNGVSITAYERVIIGKNCQIASCTFISDTDFHPINPSLRLRESMGYKIDFNTVNKKAVTIGNNVWVGWGVIILKGVTIGDNSIIAAGSVILKDVPPNVLVAGNPATVKKIIDGNN